MDKPSSSADCNLGDAIKKVGAGCLSEVFSKNTVLGCAQNAAGAALVYGVECLEAQGMKTTEYPNPQPNVSPGFKK